MQTEDLDNDLLSGVISQESYKKLLEAEVYGTATPMQWLEKRLLLILSAVNSGVVVSFDTGIESGQIETSEEFSVWCEKYFPDAYHSFIAGKHKHHHH
ncbi:hypothetical protein [Aliagarivorans marinus]|uniref:hypothetical protein n=1 Tax=Aliagarivorans marinus TaxID=561965 RepID=UPI00040497A6|nr:hypothetical protein [Aliagarivorans marinus]